MNLTDKKGQGRSWIIGAALLALFLGALDALAQCFLVFLVAFLPDKFFPDGV